MLACVGVRGNSFTSDRLSTTLEQALPDLVDLVAQVALGQVPIPARGEESCGGFAPALLNPCHNLAPTPELPSQARLIPTGVVGSLGQVEHDSQANNDEREESGSS